MGKPFYPPLLSTLAALPAPPAGATFRPGARTRLVAAVARVKKAPKYEGTIETDLNIATPSGGMQPAKPSFTGTSLGGGIVRLDWQKGGWTGVRSQMRRKGDANWTDLGLDLQSPLVDKTPLSNANQPEVCEYQMQYIDGDKPIGAWSDIASVTTT